jgi:nuclear pore complex protein Nup54
MFMLLKILYSLNYLGSGGGAFSFSSTPSTSLFRPTATFGNQTTTPFGGFQQQQQQPLFQQQQQPQQQQNSEIANLCTAVTACAVFGDDRDALMARWNLLQASWGVGKAYYNAAAPPVTLTADNPLCRFKAVGYSAMPKTDKVSSSCYFSSRGHSRYVTFFIFQNKKISKLRTD